MVGLPPLKVEFGRRYLDYKALVRPHVIMDTFQNKIYEHTEDFFFRSVHLGTECWAFIALQRLDSAKKQLATYSHWHNAAAHILSATHILSYLGDHIMMLTSMILRDYLRLKVEIEGTSGEGSSHVKSLRQTVQVLINPLMERLRGELRKGKLNSDDPRMLIIANMLLANQPRRRRARRLLADPPRHWRL